MSNRVRCQHCGLINFSHTNVCKRCRNPLTNVNYSGEGTTVNININLTGTGSQPPPRIVPRVNRQIAEQPSNPEPQLQQISFQTPETHQQSNSPFDSLHSQQYDQQFNQPQFNQPFNSQFSQPFAPPSMMRPPGYAPHFSAMSGQGVWRHGSELVVHRNAALPDSCVCCGEFLSTYSGGSFIKQKYRWHNPLVYIALMSPLIYLVLSLVLSQRFELNVPLCDKHTEDRSSTKKFMIGAAVFIFIFTTFCWSAGSYGFVFLLLLASLIGFSLASEYLYKPLRASKIENDYIYLKGASEEYLSQFPYC